MSLILIWFHVSRRGCVVKAILKGLLKLLCAVCMPHTISAKRLLCPNHLHMCLLRAPASTSLCVTYGCDKRPIVNASHQMLLVQTASLITLKTGACLESHVGIPQLTCSKRPSINLSFDINLFIIFCHRLWRCFWRIISLSTFFPIVFRAATWFLL